MLLNGTWNYLVDKRKLFLGEKYFLFPTKKTVSYRPLHFVKYFLRFSTK